MKGTNARVLFVGALVACTALAVAAAAPAAADVSEEGTAWCDGDGYVDPDGGDPLASEVEPEPDVTEEPPPLGWDPNLPPPWGGDPHQQPPPAPVPEAAIAMEGSRKSTKTPQLAKSASTATAADASIESEDVGEGELCMGHGITRWVKVVDMHVAEGFKATFFYRRGKETRTQTAVTFDGGSWQVGGWRTEILDRGAAREVPKRGPYHRRLYAEYRYGLYQTCYGVDGSYFCEKRYRPLNWTGDLKRSVTTLSQPRLQRDHAVQLPIGQSFETEDARNKVYDIGVVIRGLGLASQAGYSTITKLRWTATGCWRRWVAGYGQDPTVAPVVYTYSVGC